MAIEICRILNKNEYQAFIVGGCVRDLILKQKPKDWDICTDASPNKIIELFEKTIPTGLQHGTVTICMGEGVENHFEVTTFRIEGEYTDGRRPDEVFFVMDVEQDLARRDLTFNAIAYDPINERIVDPFNGQNDLKNKIIKAVGNPSIRFQEDGLRIMRVARFAARFGYAVDQETFNGMKSNLDTLNKVSKERIKDELCKILMSDSPSYGMQLLSKSGTLDIACPLLIGRQLPMLPYQDKCKGDLETRLAFLYNKLPIANVQEELLKLKFSTKEIKKVIFLLDLLERFSVFQEQNTINSYKSFMALIKNHAPDPWSHTLSQFIGLAEALGIEARALLLPFSKEVVLCRKEMQLNGNDLMEAGWLPGPNIKKCLDACYLEILRYSDRNYKSYLINYAKQSQTLLLDLDLESNSL